MAGFLLCAIAVYDTGFANATGDAQYYPRLICCLSDMKEAWSLWGLRHMTCPVCVVSKKDLNRTDTTYNTRPDFMLTTAIRDYERMDERAQFDFAADIRRVNGHFPVRVRGSIKNYEVMLNVCSSHSQAYATMRSMHT